MIDTKLDGKTAIVTGANNPMGIGAGIARALAAQGVRVFVTYFQQPLPEDVIFEQVDQPGEGLYRWNASQDAKHLVEEIRSAGGTIEAMEVDLRDVEVIPRIFDVAEDAFGAVDILVNNAAYSTSNTFLPGADNLVNTISVDWLSGGTPMITADSHDKHFEVNARAAALMMAEFARRSILREAGWGRIINISTAGAYCFPSEISYGASKQALESYSRSAASELGQFGITVNTLSLGPVQTGWINEEMREPILQSIPLRRIGTPEEVADVAVFLASEQARWVSGQTLGVGGGHGM